MTTAIQTFYIIFFAKSKGIVLMWKIGCFRQYTGQFFHCKMLLWQCYRLLIGLTSQLEAIIFCIISHQCFSFHRIFLYQWPDLLYARFYHFIASLYNLLSTSNLSLCTLSISAHVTLIQYINHSSDIALLKHLNSHAFTFTDGCSARNHLIDGKSNAEQLFLKFLQIFITLVALGRFRQDNGL